MSTLIICEWIVRRQDDIKKYHSHQEYSAFYFLEHPKNSKFTFCKRRVLLLRFNFAEPVVVCWCEETKNQKPVKVSLSKPAEGDLGLGTNAVFFSELALMPACHPRAEGVPLVEDDRGMKTKQEACCWRDSCSHNSLHIVSMLICRRSELYHLQFSIWAWWASHSQASGS